MNNYLQIEPRSFSQYLAIKTSADKAGVITAEVKASVEGSQARRTESYSMVGTTGVVQITGLLVPKRDWRLEWYEIEHTAYTDIYDALVELERDDRVDQVEIYLNTPGGFIDGLDETVELIKNYSKPVIGRVGTMALSAGYKIGSVCTELHATTPGSMFGSIGTVVELVDFSGWEKEVGIETHEITNRSSKNKRPNISSEEGRDVIRDELDQIHEVFEGYIVSGRSGNENFTLENVRNLEGAVVTSKHALKIGLIDSVLADANKPFGSNGDGITETNKSYSKGVKMSDLKKMCAEDPKLQEQLDEIVKYQSEKAVATAVADDRKRMGQIATIAGVKKESSVVKAIEDGTDAGQFAISFVEEMRANPDGADAGNNGGDGSQTSTENTGEERSQSQLPTFKPADPKGGAQAARTPAQQQEDSFLENV